MADTFSKADRRRIMQSVRREGTKPESNFKNALDRLRITYVQNQSKLPGKPDFVFPGRKLAVFIHGCFWHGHERCRKGNSRPKSNRQYWKEKIERNQRRDRRVAGQLRRLGFKVYTLWECDLRTPEIPKRIRNQLPRRGGH